MLCRQVLQERQIRIGRLEIPAHVIQRYRDFEQTMAPGDNISPRSQCLDTLLAHSKVVCEFASKPQNPGEVDTGHQSLIDMWAEFVPEMHHRVVPRAHMRKPFLGPRLIAEEM